MNHIFSTDRSLCSILFILNIKSILFINAGILSSSRSASSKLTFSSLYLLQITLATSLSSKVFIPFIIMLPFAIRIEQTAGYYECQKCHHKYIPTYSSVLFAMHMNRTRYMKCPKCNQRSWQRKVLTKE